MLPKYQFSFRENSHMTKIWRTTFLKEFFNEFLFKAWEYEYIYIAIIKFGKQLNPFKMTAKTFLSRSFKMLIYVN